jgi:hypothetical protein
LLALLDVAVEFRYDIRLCRFALDQLSFGPQRASPAQHLRLWLGRIRRDRKYSGWPANVKGPRAGHVLHGSQAKLGESTGPPLHYACPRVNVTISAPSDGRRHH